MNAVKYGAIKSFYLTLVRHGETHSNKDGIVAGQTDAPLSVVGVSQASRLGEHLAEEHYTHWISSDLSRARNTAELVMAANRHATGAELVMDSRLRERDFGEAEGLTWAELKEKAKERNVKMCNYDPPDGETLQKFKARVSSFFCRVCRTVLKVPLFDSACEVVHRLEMSDGREDGGDDVPEANVIVFTHGGFARQMCVYLESSVCCDFKGRSAASPVSNTGVTRFLVRAAIDEISGALCACADCVLLRDTSHLDTKSVARVSFAEEAVQ